MEFLTPEDATSALSFDGRSFTGSILKIRRPKDFVEVPVRLSIILTFFLPISCLSNLYFQFHVFILLYFLRLLAFISAEL